mgnify:CR=1 FL=1
MTPKQARYMRVVNMLCPVDGMQLRCLRGKASLGVGDMYVCGQEHKYEIWRWPNRRRPREWFMRVVEG